VVRVRELSGLGTPTDRMLLMVHQLRQAIAAATRDGKLNRKLRIFFPIYAETLPAPTGRCRPALTMTPASARSFRSTAASGTFWTILSVRRPTRRSGAQSRDGRAASASIAGNSW